MDDGLPRPAPARPRRRRAARARELGAEHADFRFERMRERQPGAARRPARRPRRRRTDRGSPSGGGGRHLGLRRRARPADRAAAAAARRAGGRGGRGLPAAQRTERVELADEPVHADAHLGLVATRPTRSTCPTRSRPRCSPTGRAPARGRRRRPRRRLAAARSRRTSSTPTRPGTATTQQRVRLHPRADRGGASTTTGHRDDAHHRAAGRPRLGVPHRRRAGTGTASWPSCRSCWPRSCAAPSVEAGRVRPGRRPVQPVADHPRVRSATPPSWTGRSATRRPTPARRSPPLDQLGTLRYGCDLMNVTGDRTAEHGWPRSATTTRAWPTQSWDIVRDGVLVGYQLDRRMAGTLGPAAAPTAAPSPTPPCTCRCSGWPTSPCSRPPSGPSTEELIAGVERGIYVVGDKSWSIDMQRYNFQFTGQRFYRIENGRLAGQLRDVAYQATTTDFWGSMAAVGGPQTYVPRRRLQLRQGPAGPGRRGQPRRPGRAVPGRQHPQHAQEAGR